MNAETRSAAINSSRRAPSDQDGMTIVEVMVAMVILVISVLGVVTMLDTGNRLTNLNIVRDTGASLAREQLEKARDVSYPTPAEVAAGGNGFAYDDLADPAAVAEYLASATSGSTAASGAVFTTVRHNVTFTSTITSCVVDDPSDGIGVVDGQACKPLPGGSGGGGGSVSTPGSGSSLNLNVLGIQVTGGGALIDAVCSLVGRNSVLDGLLGSSGALSPLVSAGADTTYCSAQGSNVAFDRQAADATAVTTTVTWTRPSAGSLTHRAVVTGPRVTTS